MPARFRTKDYKKEGIYHIYNKGIDGREIFSDNSDYEQLLEIISQYLTAPKPQSESRYKSERPYRIRHKQEMRLVGEAELMAYCLMPDHIHFLIRQTSEDAIVKFMRRVFTKYVMYYNGKYHRRGGLFEGVYKGVLVPDWKTAVYLSRMIHLNPVTKTVRRYGPVETVTGSQPEDYLYSSYQYFIHPTDKPGISPGRIKDEFERHFLDRWSSYSQFVRDSRLRMDEMVAEYMLDER